jgi:MinD-like ATPase involved in chromosome partitioning or flagellar assembly
VAKIVAVHSFRGGTGKSNITANLSTLVARRGHRVAVVDTDISSPGIHVLFGLTDLDVENTLNDFLAGRCDIEAAAHAVASVEGRGALFVIPARLQSSAITKVLREGYDVGVLVDGLRDVIGRLALDYLFIDTHPGLNDETLLAITISDALFVVLRPDQQDYLGTAVTVDVARKLDVPNLYLIVNKVPGHFTEGEVRSKVNSAYGVPVAAVLPHCDEMMELQSASIFALRYPRHALTRQLEDALELLR